MRTAWIPIEGLSDRVQGFCTTRHHGLSAKPFDSLNLGDHVGDDPATVQANRQRLAQWLPSAPVWVRQVHGTRVLDASEAVDGIPREADALVTGSRGVVLGILTADCMPIVLVNHASSVLGIAHAGWRGLAGGVLTSTVDAMADRAGSLGDWSAWIGPCIGPHAFQVGDEVRDAFLGQDPALARCFRKDDAPHKWLCDMPAIARHFLLALGASSVTWCGLCTVEDEAGRFFSYRREGQTGRMATVVWLA